MRASNQRLDGTWKVSYIRKKYVDWLGGGQTPLAVVKPLVQQVVVADNMI